MGSAVWRKWQVISCWDQRQTSPVKLWAVMGSAVWTNWQVIFCWDGLLNTWLVYIWSCRVWCVLRSTKRNKYSSDYYGDILEFVWFPGIAYNELMQCAAVTTQSFLMREPPQKKWPLEVWSPTYNTKATNKQTKQTKQTNIKRGRITHNSQRAQILQPPFYLPSKE